MGPFMNLEPRGGSNAAGGMVSSGSPANYPTEKRLQLPEDMPTLNNAEITPIKVLSSEDFGDPTLYETLRWHISKCVWCQTHENDPPPSFGHFDTRKCQEYYDIVREYSDYERDYGMKGNP